MSMAQVAVTGICPPIRACVIQIVHRPLHGGSSREIAVMRRPGDAQAVHRNVSLCHPATMLTVVVPILAKSSQSRGVHPSVRAVAMHEQGRANAHAELVPMKPLQLFGERIQPVGEECGAIVISQHVMNLTRRVSGVKRTQPFHGSRGCGLGARQRTPAEIEDISGTADVRDDFLRHAPIARISPQRRSPSSPHRSSLELSARPSCGRNGQT